MEISVYASEHAREIADLFHRAVHAVDPQIYSLEQQEAWAPSPPDYRLWAQRLERKRPWLALIDERVAGFIELDPDGHIDCLYVHPEFQRRGVAGALYAHLEFAALQRGLTLLYVEASQIAQPFFEKRGFHTLETNRVLRDGVLLVNHSMEKALQPMARKA